MEHYGFFNGDTEYGQEEFNRYFDNIYESGIAADSDQSLQYPLSISSGKVQVGIGFSILRGFFHYNDSIKKLTLTPDTNLPKIYRILLQLNIANRTVTLVARAGSAASSPAPPTLNRNESIYELSLAQYQVEKSGAVSLVKDERPDVTVCGVIRPKTVSGYDTAMKDNQRRFEEWFARQQGTGWRNIYIQDSEPEGAVDGSIWIGGE